MYAETALQNINAQPMGWSAVLEKSLDIVLHFLGKHSAGKAFLDAGRIGNIMREIRQKQYLNVDCVLLMMANNGGKEIKPHDFKYRSIVDGDFDGEKMNNMNMGDYKMLPIDFAYSEMLGDLYVKKKTGIIVSEMENKELKSIYLSQNLKRVIYFFLHDRTDRYWYLMIGTTKEGEMLETQEHQNVFYLSVNKIKNIISHY